MFEVLNTVDTNINTESFHLIVTDVDFVTQRERENSSQV